MTKNARIIFVLIGLILIISIPFIFSDQALAGVKITSPANGATVGGVVPIVVDYWQPSPSCPIYTIAGGKFYHSFYPPVTSGTYTFNFDTSVYGNGESVTIYLIDNGASSNCCGTPDSITVTVNNPSPFVAITSPADGAKIPSDQSTFPFSIAFHNVAPNVKGIKWVSLSTSAGNLIQSYIIPSQTSGTYTCNLNISSWGIGNYQLNAYVQDDSGKGGNAVPINISKVPPGPKTDPTKEAPEGDTTKVGEPINVANGNMSTSQTDILIPAKEIPLVLSRSYNSSDDFNGQFGYGWRSNFDINLKEYPDGSVVEVDEDGVYTIYTRNPVDGSYTPSAGKYTVLTRNPDSTFSIMRKHGRKLSFDAQGRLVKIQEKNGNAITISRSVAGAISEVDDPSGRKLLFTNDAQGRATQVIDPASRAWKYEYDANGNLAKRTDPLNNITAYQYDANHKLTLATDANNHTLNFEYDPSGRACHSWQDGNINEITLSFDPTNQATTVTDSRGAATKYEYNTYGLVTKVIDAQNNTQITVWDANMNKTSFTDQNAHSITSTYDNRGNLLTVTDPLSNTTTFTYEPNFDFVKTATDAQGHVTTYDYDVNGNLIKLTDALGNFTANVYDASGQLASSTNPKNYSTNFTYDGYGDVLTTTDALGNLTIFAYDIVGNRIQVKDAQNNITQFIYNNLNQLTRITYPDNSVNSYTYDALGNKVSATDNASNIFTYAYDLNNHVTSVTNPLGKTIAFEYDTEGNKTKVTDQDQHATSYQYDSLNRLTSETNPLGSTRTYTYDAAGNKISLTDANNNKISYEYDSLNHLTKINYPVGSVSFVYDSLGRRMSMTDDHGTKSYTYDQLSRLTQVQGPGPNDTLQYTYDVLGNRTSLTLPGGKTVRYNCDALNRLVSIIDPNNKTTAYTYDTVGNLISAIYPNNIQAGYAFDALHRLTHLVNQNQSNQQKLSEFSYIYDQAGRKSKATLLDGAIDYAYDASGELIQESKSSGSNPYQTSYEYDPAGNRTRMVKDGKEHLYTYNNANQLTQENINGLATVPITVTGTVNDANGIQSASVNGIKTTLTGTNFTCQINLSAGVNNIVATATDSAGNSASQTVHVTYNQTSQIVSAYDNNGNLISRQSPSQTLNLSYDYENRLKSVTSGTTNLTYGYDGEGKRISYANGQTVINYFYDGSSVILERNGAGDPVTSYLRNPGAAGGIGGIINAQQGSSPETYYSYDGLGSVVNISDASGANLQSYSYDAFGNTLASQGTSSNTHQFLTKETDSSGLTYFGARYYDSTIGRFITQDPTGMSDGPNMYLYCGNDPVDFIDLFGLCVEIGYKKIIGIGDWAIWHTFIRVTYQGETKTGGFNATNIAQLPLTLLGITISGNISTEAAGKDFKTVSSDPTKAMIVYNLIDSKKFAWTHYKYWSTNCYNWRDTVLTAAGIESPSDLPWKH